ncbi:MULTISPECIES: peptidase [unclassified Sphingomonas]|uniref:peptidase n=1 Tax=unclassified Sphingomonas TaxID=196159 RepID=UPI0009274FBA|nr:MULTISPECIES: peptidase [unclassified Sphingomonas]OJU18013.1 MAG: peptidase [Sphingomonas sp. 66-10]
MTYCVAVRVTDGLVLLSDTRTNAGLDNISRFTKMFTWEVPGERAIGMMCSGNLSITQGVMTRLAKAIERSADDPDIETILNADSIFRIAELVGEAMQAQQDRYRESIQAGGVGADAMILVAGQRKGGRHRLFMVYAAGNFVEATSDTPYFQIGEHKYGKPILDRVVTIDTPLEQVVKAVCVSMDSTLHSNLSVGMPLDLAVLRRDRFAFQVRERIEADDPRFQNISREWGGRLREAFLAMPDVVSIG